MTIPSPRRPIVMNLVRVEELRPGYRINGQIAQNRFRAWAIEREVVDFWRSKVPSPEPRYVVKWKGRSFKQTFDAGTWLNVVLDDSMDLTAGEVLDIMGGDK